MKYLQSQTEKVQTVLLMYLLPGGTCICFVRGSSIREKFEEHCIKMSGRVEKSATGITWLLNGVRRSHDVKFKLIVINCAKKTNYYNAARKFSVAEANVQMWINGNSM